MAASRTVWGIDIGQCALKAVKLSHDSKADRAVAEAFDYIEHAKILSQPDADEEELVHAALEKFLSRNSVEDDQVYISVPGQAGLARFVKLPPVEPKKIPEIVNFEARQQIPFPLDDVVWDYQRIGGAGEDEDEQVEVGIFAIKRDVAKKYLAPFDRMGIEVNVVQLAPVSIYNAIAFDYFWHGQKEAGKPAGEEGEKKDEAAAEGGAEKPAEPAKEEEEEEEGDSIVVLDMGADKTDVVITDGDAIWLRSLPIGGNHFTRALTKEMKLSFAKAEHLKRNAVKTAPAEAKKLYQAMRPVFQDFVSELQRSIGYFSSTHRDRVIKKVVGVGNGFKLPGLQKFLEQSLNQPVERLESFKGLSGDEVLKTRAFAENLTSFCVAYGLAIQGLEQTPLQTDLLPTEIAKARMIRQKKPWILTAAAAVLVGFSIMFLGNYRVYSAVHDPAFEGPIGEAKAATTRINTWESDFAKQKGNYQSTLTKGYNLLALDETKARTDWIEVFKVINSLLPGKDKTDDVELGEIESVNVEYIDAGYFANLNDWFGGIDPTAKNTMKEEDKTKGPSGEGWVFQIRGYSFHKDFVIYVKNVVLGAFQSDGAKALGISHAVLAWENQDPEWTPGKGSAALKTKGSIASEARKLVKAPAAGGAGKAQLSGAQGQMKSQMMGAMGGGSASAGGYGGGGYGGMMQQMMGGGGMDMAEFGGMPSDMLSYQQQSLDSRKSAEQAMYIMRTDFAIQFVWTPPRLLKEKAGAANDAAKK